MNFKSGVNQAQNGDAKITCEDGNDNILKTQIPFTDFKDTEVISGLKMKPYPSER
jgi:hypothetical protein